MNATCTVDVGDILDLAATFMDGRKAAEQLTKRLVRTVAEDSQERFEAQNFAPRKADEELTAEGQAKELAASIEQAHGRAVLAIRSKLRRDFKRARKRRDKAAQSIGTAKAEALYKAADERYAILKEFERRVAGGGSGFSLAREKDSKKLAKQMASVEERFKRSAEHYAGKILGKLAGANKSTTRGTSGEVRNMAKFSEVMFEGGRVGNGAQLPARPALGDSAELSAKLEDTTESWLGHLGGE